MGCVARISIVLARRGVRSTQALRVIATADTAWFYGPGFFRSEHAQAPERRGGVPLADCKYSLCDDGVSLSIHDGKRIFNRACKRGRAILVTGDRLRFCLMTAIPEDKQTSQLVRLGDGRLRLLVGGRTIPLDETDGVQTLFLPGATEYRIHPPDVPEIELKVKVALAGDWGLAVECSVRQTAVEKSDITLELLYGGLMPNGEVFIPGGSYCLPEQPALSTNVLSETDRFVLIAEESIPVRVRMTVCPGGEPPVIGDGNVRYIWRPNPSRGESFTTYFVAAVGGPEEAEMPEDASAPVELIAQTELYFRDLLGNCEIATPCPVLDAGFRTAVLNQEYMYDSPAWLEGVGWWSAYWVNNYQISAAIALGQIERARRALAFFAGERGPCPPRYASGKQFISEEAHFYEDGIPHCDEDGLPYYLYQLCQYHEASGDPGLFLELWPACAKALTRFWQIRDPDGNALVNWRLGANCFLYQADNLGMPGDAASPSLMMAGVLDRVVKILKSLSMEAEADKWSELAERIYAKLLEVLWHKEAGVFYNHRDLQNITHTSHYYTDLIFPGLYTSLPPEYGWQSLEYLDRNLCLKTSSNLPLMRVGEFKPSAFGNDNVMPTQMAEAARAYFWAGKADRGLALLESVALAGTIHTEAPGNFPEQMSDEGEGQRHFLFGNPAASCIYAIIGGLFGLELIDGGTTLVWSPALPVSWGQASLRLPYVGIECRAELTGATRTTHYRAVLDSPRRLRFSLCLPPGRVRVVSSQGYQMEHNIEPWLNGSRLTAECPASLCHEITVIHECTDLVMRKEQAIIRGSKIQWELTPGVAEILDPQDSLSEIELTEQTLYAVASGEIGYHQIFLRLADPELYLPLDIEIKRGYQVRVVSGIYDAIRGLITLSLAVTVPGLPANKGMLMMRLCGKEAALPIEPTGWDVIFKTVDFVSPVLPVEGVYVVGYRVMVDGAVLFDGNQNVVLDGGDERSQEEMRHARDERTRGLDLSSFFTLAKMSLPRSDWHLGQWPFFREDFCTPDGILRTPAGCFSIPLRGPFLAMIELGYSDPYTRETRNSAHPSSLAIPVAKRALMLSLLYASDMECRHTGAVVGRIELVYADGQVAVQPLIGGRQIDRLNMHCAMEAIPVQGRGGYHLDILRLPCDPGCMLIEARILIDAADVSLAILAINITEA